MAAQHVSIPKPFKEEDDAREWFQRFEICCQANEWNDAKKARNLPTLLEGEPLSICLEATEEEQAEFRIKDHYQNMVPIAFSSLQEFHSHKMLPGEAVSPYLFELKRLLDQAIMGLANDARDRLLITPIFGRITGVSESATAGDR